VTDVTIADKLGEHIEELADFRDRFARLERSIAETFLLGDGLQSSGDLLALLRYADLLSHSSRSRHRELAYVVVSMSQELIDSAPTDPVVVDRVKAVTEAVLVQLGNFPGLRTLDKTGRSERSLPVNREIARIAKEAVQTTRRGDRILTDAQFQIATRMRGTDYFSFSGPTSLGKSFILKDLIYEVASSAELNGRAIVMLVPTKALIGQTAADLRAALEGIDGVNVATYPTLPKYILSAYNKTILVLTPERLLKYLSNPRREIEYLIVDEAQRLIAENDARSSLYYHAITEAVRRFATKLVFSSPSIANPELFLELFEKSTRGALAVRERTVSQQRYFLDLVNRQATFVSLLDSENHRVDNVRLEKSTPKLIRRLAGRKQAIVYVNGSAQASELALTLAEGRPKIKDPRVDALIKFVREYVHPDYYLARCLRRGVAFHHGKMPQEIRERVEALYAVTDSPLRLVVCTSTLLEGVNLPAKTIFVMSDMHGPRNFTAIDFDNLVGRAGRLTYDFSGRVVVVRTDMRRWSGSTRDLVNHREPEVAGSFLVNPGRRTKDYTDMARVIRGEVLPGKPSADEVRSVQQYASILLLQHRDGQSTPLTSFFIDKVEGGKELLRKAAGSLAAPIDAHRGSPDILPASQERVWRHLQNAQDAALVPKAADLTDAQTFHDALRKLSLLYDWPRLESQGRDPLVPGKQGANVDGRLWYWALLMRSWVRGDPLSRLIRESIRFHEKQGTITFWNYTEGAQLVTEVFDRKRPSHVNRVIERAFSDLEGGLRFRIIGYLQNYRALSVSAVGEESAGVDLAALVEYGTVDPRAIQLQEIGLSRSTAAAVLEYAGRWLQFNDAGELEDIDRVRVLAQPEFDEETLSELRGVLMVADRRTSPGN
jgi:superfamily II DNA/RNA helicase